MVLALPSNFVLLVGLSLLTVRDVKGVSCTLAPTLNTCQCTLSGGYHGLVDLAPIFKNGAIHINKEQQKTIVYFANLQPCGINPFAVAWIHEITDITFHYGSLQNVSQEWRINHFEPEDDKFEFIVTFPGTERYYPLEVTFTYDSTVDYKLTIEPYYTVFRHPNSTMKLQLLSKYVKPLLIPGDSVGPYTVQHNACAGWEGQRTLLGELGLFSLTSSVVKLNSTITTADSKYYLGICVNPMWVDISDITSCFAVKRTSYKDGYQYLCIGRSRHAQLTDQRDQGWMLLRYPFGDFIEECKDYAVTEILLTCSDQDGTSPMFPENSLPPVCQYHFIWPTHLACPNVTSPSESPSPFNVSSILLGMSGSIVVLLLVVLVGVSITSCYFCARRRTSSAELN